MSEEHIREKKALERTAIRIFLKLHNDRFVPPYRLLYQQERPDAVLEDLGLGRKQMGLEITHLFYDANEAKRLLGRSQQASSQTAPATVDVWLAELNERIRSKEEKFADYSHAYPLSLLIRNASPAFGMEDLIRNRDAVLQPRGCFERMWFLSRDGGDEWMLADLGELLFTKK